MITILILWVICGVITAIVMAIRLDDDFDPPIMCGILFVWPVLVSGWLVQQVARAGIRARDAYGRYQARRR